MKNLVKTLAVAVLMLCAAAASAQNYGRYEVRRDRVYFNGMEVRTADARWFNDLGYGYGKDRNHVYMNGQILPYVDPSSFKVDRRYGSSAPVPPTPPDMDKGHMHDHIHGGSRYGYVVYGNSVLYDGRVVSGARASSFADLGWGYAMDSFDVFYCGRKIHASTMNFKTLKDGYAKNSFDVYYNGSEVKNASASSFKALKDGYASDAFRIYYCGKEVKGVMASTFRILKDGYASDAFNTYYKGVKVR